MKLLASAIRDVTQSVRNQPPSLSGSPDRPSGSTPGSPKAAATAGPTSFCKWLCESSPAISRISPAMGAAVAAANTAAASRTSTGSLGDDHRGRHLRLEAIDRGGICQVRPAVLGALGEFLRLLAIGRSGEVSDQPGGRRQLAA